MKEAYKSVSELVETFVNWQKKYFECSNIQKLNPKQLVLYLGNFYLSKFNNFILAHKINKKKLPNDLNQSIKSNKASIITDSIKNAIKNICRKPVISSLWKIKFISDYVQDKKYLNYFYLSIF